MDFQFSHSNLCVSQTSIKNSIFLPRTSSARWFLIFAAESSSKCCSVNRSWTGRLKFDWSQLYACLKCCHTIVFPFICRHRGFPLWLLLQRLFRIFFMLCCKIYCNQFSQVKIKFLSMHIKILSSFLALIVRISNDRNLTCATLMK